MKYKQENNKITPYSLSQIKDIQEVQFATKEQFEEKGYFDLVTPTYDKLTHKLGEMVFDDANKVFTYNIVELSEEEKEEKLSEKKQARYIIIDEVVKGLLNGSLSIILGLKGLSNEEVQTRKELYETLYNVAIKENPSASETQLLQTKWQLFKLKYNVDITFEYYKTDVVIARWLQGKTAFNNFKLMIEVIRTKWKATVLDDDRFTTIQDNLNSLDENTNPADVPDIFAQIMSV